MLGRSLPRRFEAPSLPHLQRASPQRSHAERNVKIWVRAGLQLKKAASPAEAAKTLFSRVRPSGNSSAPSRKEVSGGTVPTSGLAALMASGGLLHHFLFQSSAAAPLGFDHSDARTYGSHDASVMVSHISARYKPRHATQPDVFVATRGGRCGYFVSPALQRLGFFSAKFPCGLRIMRSCQGSGGRLCPP